MLMGGGNKGFFKDSTARDQIASLTGFLSFTHFVQLTFNTSVLDTIKTAFVNKTIPVDLNGVTIGVVVAGAGGNRAVFIAQNQSDPSTTQTRYSAIYFGAYIAPRVCRKQDGAEWTDVAL